MRLRVAGLVAALALLSACGRVVPPSTAGRPGARPPATALQIGVHPGPPIGTLRFTPTNARKALAAFAASCSRLSLRTDNSGLTQPQDWAAPCQAASGWPAEDAQRFFLTWFDTAQVGEGTTYVTGYFEPEISGSRTHQPGFDVPIYRLPPDLVRAKPGDAPPGPDGKQPLGRYDANGLFVPYWDREQIEDGALAGKGLEIGWASDPAEFFFLQVQGSGRLRAPDGSIMRIGYAGENGWAYTGIGSVMNSQGLIGTGPGQYPGSMQGILRYIREHPDEGRALMRQNRSFIFFRDTTGIASDPGAGPVGALSVPVTPRVTLAADPAFVTLGAPVWLSTDRPEVGGLWVAQDTGGAIKGANRFDSFWGAGAEARRIAGGMSARGHALILLPRSALARLPRK
ncbi:MltA [Novosphingobium nitrogenifigens DSM 19370]|uniref:peptidoglycan lytic exotransglycosylase n=1 Tax=Novosphingobium nitrogenifigens DSM 19370 TaxID=983920 RepID=F1Z645_9SPHN|nr:MltA domain-containing protein [Novosphingobium nitrogenifigens]EGD59827.1 MltA [Novosphingobium nitrogenifigens DSM 19370]